MTISRFMLAMTLCIGIMSSGGVARATEADVWNIGLASAKITPEEPVLLSGYGGRDKPFEGVDGDLYTKCLALEDQTGALAVLITMDTECMRPHTADPLCDRIMKRTGLRRDQILLNFSHSHAAPFLSLDPNTRDYGSTPETARKTVAHTNWMLNQIVDTVERALASRQPSRLYFGTGFAPFVMNRREFTPTGLKIGINPRGYADRSVPVLRVDGLEGKPRAIVFGCASHNTTSGPKNFVVSGDYAGHAQAYVESHFPDVQAMFMIGCGADINPYPRGTIELAKEHGATLGGEVEKFLLWNKSGDADRRTGDVSMTPVKGPLCIAFEDIALPLRRLPGLEAMKAEAEGEDRWKAYHAKMMIECVEAGKPVPTEWVTPLTVWRFGDDLTMVGFSGEVVAEYAPMVEQILGHNGLWVAAYCNELYGYIPTVQIIEEGGYETRGLEDGEIGQFDPTVEKVLLGKVAELAEAAKRSNFTEVQNN